MKRFLLLLCSALALAGAGPADAQTARPQLKSVVQSGGQRGTTVQVTLTGTNIGYGTQLRFEDAGLVVESLRADPAPANAKNAEGKLTATVRIAPDAALGRHALRVATPLGASDTGYVVVGQWPEIAEKEPNNARAQAQTPACPVTVIGRSDAAEDVDWYHLPMRQGETYVLQAEAASIGSPMTPAMTLWDTRGYERAAQNALGSKDALLIFTAPQSGEYLLQIRDLRYQGSAEHLYRLTIGRIPFVTGVFPLGGTAGAAMTLTLTGVNLPAAAECRLRLPAETPPSPHRTALSLATGLSNLVDLDIGTAPEVLETEENDRPDAAPAVPLPSTINGRIAAPTPGKTDADCFRFAAAKGQVVLLEVIARRVGSRLDPVLTVHDTRGRELARNDDAFGQDPYLEFAAPEAGDYVVRVADLNDRSGPEFGYRLRIAAAMPDFTVDFAPDCPAIGPGDRIPFTLTAARRHGFEGDIALEIADLPAGVQWLGDPVLRRGQNETTLFLTATPEAKAQTTALQVSGAATIGGTRVTRRARSLQEIYVKQNDQVVRTTRPTTSPLFTVVSTPDLIVRADPVALRLEAGKTVEILVQAQRAAGFTAKIPLIVRGLPAGVSAVNPEIPEKQNEVKLTLKAEASAAPGVATLVILGRAVVDELRFSDHATLPLTLTLTK